jgi:UDP-3-O-[3-hydroxymyristoyl] glucosamine N-acyltransferase
MEKNIPLKDIIKFLGSEITTTLGNPDGIYLRYLRDIQNVDEFTLDWIGTRLVDKQLLAEKSRAKAILVNDGVEYSNVLVEQGKVLLIVQNPKLAVAKVGNAFFVEKPNSGIHPAAVVHPMAEIGNNVFIGAGTTIGKCKIGNEVIIHPNVTLYDNVEIKNNVIIHSGAVIGTDGLGCEREDDGTLVKFPHFGGVILNDNVEIGANCQIAKGALSNTIIGKGTKINVGCYIAHNAILGKNVWVSAQAQIAGSVKIEDNATIYIGAIIREQKVIGSSAIIGMGSVVTKDVPAGETWFGNPAKKIEK